MADAEQRVHDLEAEVARIEAALDAAGVANDLARLEQLGKEHGAAHVALDEAMNAWMEMTA